MNASKILVTGANGFVGRALVTRLQKELSFSVLKAVRTTADDDAEKDGICVGDIGPTTDWSTALRDIEVVVHCAARVHVMNDDGGPASIAEFRRVNVLGTQNLARQAALAGVKRLVYVSSVKVNGETTTGLPPFSFASSPNPLDAYGRSKWEAEQALLQIASESALEVVIARLPLVYGPGVKANFLRLMKAVSRGIPLPFGAVHNFRSMIFLENLCDVLAKCAMHPQASGQTFLVSDAHDLSTPALVEHIAAAMNCPARLVKMPPTIMQIAANLAGKKNFADRLLGSLQVDITHTCKILDWLPPFAVEEGIKATVDAFLKNDASAN